MGLVAIWCVLAAELFTRGVVVYLPISAGPVAADRRVTDFRFEEPGSSEYLRAGVVVTKYTDDHSLTYRSKTAIVRQPDRRRSHTRVWNTIRRRSNRIASAPTRSSIRDVPIDPSGPCRVRQDRLAPGLVHDCKRVVAVGFVRVLLQYPPAVGRRPVPCR